MRRPADSKLDGSRPRRRPVYIRKRVVRSSASGLVALLAAASAAAVPRTARAVDPFEIQVYDGALGDPGSVGIETHINSVISGLRDAASPE